jgi:hypothetical protein
MTLSGVVEYRLAKSTGVTNFQTNWDNGAGCG